MSEKEQPNYYAIILASVRYDNTLKFAEKLLYGEITALANKMVIAMLETNTFQIYIM